MTTNDKNSMQAGGIAQAWPLRRVGLKVRDLDTSLEYYTGLGFSIVRDQHSEGMVGLGSGSQEILSLRVLREGVLARHVQPGCTILPSCCLTRRNWVLFYNTAWSIESNLLVLRTISLARRSISATRKETELRYTLIDRASDGNGRRGKSIWLRFHWMRRLY